MSRTGLNNNHHHPDRVGAEVTTTSQDCSQKVGIRKSSMVNNLTLSEGLLILDVAFSKTRKIMEGCPNIKFTPEEYQRFYECVYLLCVQRTSSENARMLHERYKSGLEECINSLVLPSLEDKNDAVLLIELVRKWSSYKVMARWLSRFFEYLDRFYIPRIEGFRLMEQACRCFYDLVGTRYTTTFIAAAITLINLDRNGELIDRSLLKNVVEYFDATRIVGGTSYDDFRNALLVNAGAYYSQIASNGLLYDSCADYMYKVQWFLNQENERACHFLDPSTTGKLLQVVKSHLVDQVYTNLLEKQQAEKHSTSTDIQDLLSKCAGLHLGDGGSGSAMEDRLGTLMLD